MYVDTRPCPKNAMQAPRRGLICDVFQSNIYCEYADISTKLRHVKLQVNTADNTLREQLWIFNNYR